MTKVELVDKVAKEANLTKVAAGKAVEAMVALVTESLIKGEPVNVVGLGTFSVTTRKARTGRNPQTGKKINIAAAKVAKFQSSKDLKAALSTHTFCVREEDIPIDYLAPIISVYIPGTHDSGDGE